MTKKEQTTFLKFLLEKKIGNMNLTPKQKEEFTNMLLDKMNEPETPKHEITLGQLKATYKKIKKSN